MSLNDIRRFEPFDVTRVKFVTRGKALVRRQATVLKVGSIHIPETSRFLDREDKADVIAVGSDVTAFKAGDVVILPDVLDALGKFTHDNMTYSIIKADDVQAVCDDA